MQAHMFLCIRGLVKVECLAIILGEIGSNIPELHQILCLYKSSVVWSYFYVLQAEKEAAEAEELKQELGLKVDDSLKAMIQKRQQSRESQMGAFFDQLEAKYAQPKKARTTSSANKETKSRKKSKKWNIVTVLFILVDTINLVMLNKLRCHTLPIFSQSDYLIQVVDINSDTEQQTVQIQISWLLKKPTDLDLHCLQR